MHGPRHEYFLGKGQMSTSKWNKQKKKKKSEEHQ